MCNSEDYNFQILMYGEKRRILPYSCEDLPLSCFRKLVNECIDDKKILEECRRNFREQPLVSIFHLLETIYPKDILPLYLIVDLSSICPSKIYRMFQNKSPVPFEQCAQQAYSYFSLLEIKQENYQIYFEKEEPCFVYDSIPYEQRVYLGSSYLFSFCRLLSLPYSFVVVDPKRYFSKQAYETFIQLVNRINKIDNKIFLIHI